MILEYLGLPKAPEREKLILNQLPAPNDTTLGAKREMLLSLGCSFRHSSLATLTSLLRTAMLPSLGLLTTNFIWFQLYAAGCSPFLYWRACNNMTFI